MTSLPKSQHEITLAMIVRDEEKHLDTCLTAFAGIYSKIIIVDTGSVDRTKAIAARHGAEIYDFKWTEDFSAARNFSLAQVKTEWTSFVDADDIIEPEDKVALIENLNVHLPTSDVVILPYIYAGTKKQPQVINHQTRFWRTGLGLKFVRPIHEYLDYHTKNLRITNLNFPVIHQKLDPYIISLERNLKILLKQVEDGTADAITYYYLGNEYDNKREYAKAVEYYEQFLQKEKNVQSDNLCVAYTKIGIEKMRQGKIDEAKKNFENAIKIKPHLIEAYLYLADIEMNLFSVQKAISLLSVARSLKPPKDSNGGKFDLYNGKADKMLQFAISKLK
jgi:glycosyltransferase involved in cell wall biosynthesis